MRLLKKLAVNAASLKLKVTEGDVAESGRLVGERVGLVEELREFADAKVSFGSSDIEGELNAIFMKMRNDISDSISEINMKLGLLSKQLERTREAKGIAVYAAARHSARRTSVGSEPDKFQGGRHGH